MAKEKGPRGIDPRTAKFSREWKQRAKNGELSDHLAPDDGPVFIGGSTYEKILVDYGLELDIKTRSVREHEEGRVVFPFNLGLSIAEGYMSYFHSADSGQESFFNQFGNWADRNGIDNNDSDWSLHQNSLLVGAGAVIKAFHYELGERLIDNIVNVDQNELFNSLNIVDEATESIWEKIAYNRRIPDFQVPLNRFINELANESYYGNAVIIGAETMYHLISDLDLASAKK